MPNTRRNNRGTPTRAMPNTTSRRGRSPSKSSEEKKRRLIKYLEKELKLIKDALKILVGVFEDGSNKFYEKYDLIDLKDRNESIFNDLEKVQDDVQEKIDKMKADTEYTSNDPSNV
jgi:hypothetical protein